MVPIVTRSADVRLVGASKAAVMPCHKSIEPRRSIVARLVGCVTSMERDVAIFRRLMLLPASIWRVSTETVQIVVVLQRVRIRAGGVGVLLRRWVLSTRPRSGCDEIEIARAFSYEVGREL